MNSAPRTCTILGSQYTNARYAEIVDYGSLENPCWGIIIHTDTGSYDSAKDTDDYSQAEQWLIESNMIITYALHPWLDVADAIEKGVIDDKANFHYRILDASDSEIDNCYGNGVELKHEHRHLEQGWRVVGFKPESWIINPTSKQSLLDRERLACVRAYGSV
jgi:hypothetical protein